MSIGEKISEVMTRRGYSQNKLAKLAQISQSGLSSIISGASSPKENTLRAIADALGVTVAELTGEDVTRPKPTDADIKFALFGGADGVTDEDYEDVKRYAAFVKARKNGGSL